MNLHFEILDKDRLEILPTLALFKDRFYLAGGTALALYLGHRDSIDFDFFSREDFDVDKLQLEIENNFKGKQLLFIQKERGAITVIVNDNIKLSFFHYNYILLKEIICTEYLNLASIEDIACMKMSAICSRSTLKDYIDIYYILGKFTLSHILDLVKVKFPTLDINVILKSLVYYDDMSDEPVFMKEGFEVKLDDIKVFLDRKVKEFVNL